MGDAVLVLVRIDDRLLHGQVITAWVPFLTADSLIVACDEAYENSLMRNFITSLGQDGLRVSVRRVRDACMDIKTEQLAGQRVILILSCLEDALKVYDGGIRFSSLNIGNLHHEISGRRLAPSVIINSDDEGILDKLEGLGVAIDIRDIPTRAAVPYRATQSDRVR